MDMLDTALAIETSRRRFLEGAAIGSAALAAGPALSEATVDLHLPGGNSKRPMTPVFPGKQPLIVQRINPPLLETPMAAFDRDDFTPNDQFYVRWHWGDIPASIDVGTYRIKIFGHVERPQSISLADLLRLPRIEYAAVNQCSGNSRGLFEPRVPGAQWGHGAMGNARWLGVRLKDLLDLAGIKAGAVQVRFGALDKPVVPEAAAFEKALGIDHARDGEVMVAFGMNGTQLPLLNGFPCRLIVPGWYSTYWVKMLDSIEVLAAPDDRYWMAKAYKVPATPDAGVVPGAKGFPTEPISRMIPRSWTTSLSEGETIPWRATLPVRGIALGGDCGVAAVDVSSDDGRTWQPATLGADHGKYSFRRWEGRVPLQRGANRILVRCRNSNGVTQKIEPIWNPSGYMRGNVESVAIIAR